MPSLPSGAGAIPHDLVPSSHFDGFGVDFARGLSTLRPNPHIRRLREHHPQTWLKSAQIQGFRTMAKPTSIKIKLESTAGTGYFYVTKKNSRTMTEKYVTKKYDPVVRKHVEFKETKIK